VNARCKDSAGSSSWAEEVSTKDKLEEIAAAMRARWQGSATAEPANAEVEPGQAEREHQAPISNQPHSPLAGVDLETAIQPPLGLAGYQSEANEVNARRSN
jgi:hypothetical protein